MKRRLGALTAAMVDKALPIDGGTLEQHQKAHIRAILGNGRAEPPIYWEWPIITQYDLETIGGTDGD